MPLLAQRNLLRNLEQIAALAPRVQPRFAAQNDDELTKAITDLLGPFEGKKPKDAPAEPAPAPAPAAAPAEDSD